MTPPLPASGALPSAFIVYWCQLTLGLKERTSFRLVHQLLLNQWNIWRAGNPNAQLPGYNSPPPPLPGKKHPHGWSYENLMRFVNPNRQAPAPTPSTASAALLLLVIRQLLQPYGAILSAPVHASRIALADHELQQAYLGAGFPWPPTPEAVSRAATLAGQLAAQARQPSPQRHSRKRKRAPHG